MGCESDQNPTVFIVDDEIVFRDSLRLVVRLQSIARGRRRL